MGYRYGEVDLGSINETKSIKIIPNPTMRQPRKPEMVSLPVYLRGAVAPRPDTSDPMSAVAGVMKRAARKTPDVDKEMISRFRKFVRKTLPKLFEPLKSDADLSFENWVQNTNYPLWRKDELRTLWTENGCKTGSELLAIRKCKEVKAFIKKEHYDDVKYPRGIYSRSDLFKIAVGPIFRLIEKEVFKHDWFIKKIPVNQRPAYITERLGIYNGESTATDYSSFEACFTKEVMEHCEFELYDYMIQNLDNNFKSFFQEVKDVVSGINTIRFKHFSCMFAATRQSGEMNTSLGNGFTNMMIMQFLSSENETKVAGVVEGDDGLFTFEHPDRAPTSLQFEKLGFIIKMQKFDCFSRASFCGLIFDREIQRNITDPYYVLATFGWTEGKYLKSKLSKKKMLLRAKAYSLAYQYPGCPILSELARYLLRVTRSFTISQKYIDSLDVWNRDKMIECLSSPIINEPVHIKTRLLMSEMYGITVEAQLHIEEYIRNLEDQDRFNLDWLLPFFPGTYIMMFDCYTTQGVFIDPPLVHGCDKVNEVLSSLKLASGETPDWIISG